MPIWQHFLVLLAQRVWLLDKNLGTSRMEIQTLAKRLNIFSIKFSKSDKRIFIIYLINFSLHLSRGVWTTASRLGQHGVKSPLLYNDLLSSQYSCHSNIIPATYPLPHTHPSDILHSSPEHLVVQCHSLPKYLEFPYITTPGRYLVNTHATRI